MKGVPGFKKSRTPQLPLYGQRANGLVKTDPAGRQTVVPFDDTGTTVIGGDGSVIPVPPGGAPGPHTHPESDVISLVADLAALASAITSGDASVAAAAAAALAAHAATVGAHFGVKRSIVLDAGDAQLVNDVSTPGANMVYGTDAGGARGWKADPVGGSGSGCCEPLTNGDPDDPEILFADGDVIMVEM